MTGVLLWGEDRDRRRRVAEVLGAAGVDVEQVGNALDATLAAAKGGFRALLIGVPMAETDLSEWLASLPALGTVPGRVVLLGQAEVPVEGLAVEGLAVEGLFGEGLEEGLKSLALALSAPPEDVLAELASLQAAYRRDLPGKLAELTAALQAGARERASTLAHKVAGAAGIHGLADIGDKAREAELLLEGDSADAVQHATKLIAEASGLLSCR